MGDECHCREAMAGTQAVKRRIEAEYERDERAVEDADYAGQMTIAFCVAADCVTERSCHDEF